MLAIFKNFFLYSGSAIESSPFCADEDAVAEHRVIPVGLETFLVKERTASLFGDCLSLSSDGLNELFLGGVETVSTA